MRANSALDLRRERAREHRLGGARDVLEQDVTGRGEGRDDERDLVVLAKHDLLDVGDEAPADVARGDEPAVVGGRHG